VKSRSTQDSPAGWSGTPISTTGRSSASSIGTRGSAASTSITISASAIAEDATRCSAAGPSSLVSSSRSWSCARAAVAAEATNSITTPTLRSVRSGTTSASTLVRLPARARAPACGWYPSRRILSSTSRRVLGEIERFPLIT
jgi:hypothetical protein